MTLLRALVCLFIVITAICCAHPSGKEQALDKVPPKALFTPEEEEICGDFQCKHFIAPCRLARGDRKDSQSLIEERYLDDADNFRQRGYCLRTPRALSEPEYSSQTCLFVFVKLIKCGT